MNLCSDNHSEVCYEGNQCPACEEMEIRDTTIEEKQSEIDDLKSQVDDLEDKVSELEEELEEHKPEPEVDDRIKEDVFPPDETEPPYKKY